MRPRCAALLALSMLALSMLAACSHGSPLPQRPARTIDAQALYVRGRRAIQAGDLVRAEQYLTLAERAGQPAADVLPWLLEICIGAGRYRAALAHAEAHLARTPDAPGLRLLTASLRHALGWTTPDRTTTGAAPKPTSATPDGPAPRDATKPATTQEELDDPGGHTPPQPDATAAPGDPSLG